MQLIKSAPSKMVHGAVIFIFLGAGVLGACGGSQGPATGSETAAATPSFDEMSAGQKMRHMKTVIAPKMQAVFARSPEPAEEKFSCGTCHGPGAKGGDFSMPTASLKKLNEEEIAEHPLMSKFMKEDVVPEMARLLGDEEFGCFDCHMRAE